LNLKPNPTLTLGKITSGQIEQMDVNIIERNRTATCRQGATNMANAESWRERMEDEADDEARNGALDHEDKAVQNLLFPQQQQQFPGYLDTDEAAAGDSEGNTVPNSSEVQDEMGISSDDEVMAPVNKGKQKEAMV